MNRQRRLIMRLRCLVHAALQLGTALVLAAHSSDGRNASERVQNRWIADVAAMNDEVRVAKRIKRFRPNQPVGI